ncbi:MAG: SsrA-binding protein SmpB [Candidatus Hydrogenedens sp.]|nr:SsrA-binding protein SmpB [Candidatus Hydrogenedens sp.]
MGEGEKTLADNRKARHDYEVLDTYEAGIALVGSEVKSLRAEGSIMLKDSYADFRSGELWLVGVHIGPYKQANILNHEVERKRKLLMHRHEIDKLKARVEEKGLTVVPLRVYFKRGKVKVLVGLCRGRQTHDKRDAIKARESKREIDRAVKSARGRQQP